MIQTVDLASKFSASVVRDSGGQIAAQFDSYDRSALSFVRECAVWAAQCDITLIEDVPYGISSQAMTKPVTRLQGVCIAFMHRNLDNLFFINPSTWQKAYPGVATAPKTLTKVEKDRFRIEAARAHAERLGYIPPNLVQDYIDVQRPGTRILKKHTDPLAKQMTDYIDAFLMNDWAYNNIATLRSMTGVQAVYI